MRLRGKFFFILIVLIAAILLATNIIGNILRVDSCLDMGGVGIILILLAPKKRGQSNFR